jgi:Flp pilus assembly protein TadG
MQAFKSSSRARIDRAAHESGIAAVEFAIVVVAFFVFIFGIIEIARLLFLYNTLQDVTRRAASSAAAIDFSNGAKMDTLRQNAIFRSSAGGLVLMSELTDQAVRIDYMYLDRASDGKMTPQAIPAGNMPVSPSDNQANCRANPYGSSCIRYARARICDPVNTDSCDPVKFNTVTSLVSFSASLPVATTITRVQSLGGTPH